MGEFRNRKNKPMKGSVRKPDTDKNDVWMFSSTKSGIKKFVPRKR